MTYAGDVTPQARAFSKWRLVAALTVMGTLLLATSAGRFAFWPCALLWAAPPIIAARCLPLPLALTVVVVSGTAGRALAWLEGLTGSDHVVVPLVATLLLVPALLVDKVLVTRFPRKGIWAWPALVGITFFVVTKLAATSGPLLASAAEALAPLPDLDGTQLLSALHPVWAVVVTGFVANGFAGAGTVLNWHVDDPHPLDVRERGVRVGALVGFAWLLALAVCGLLF